MSRPDHAPPRPLSAWAACVLLAAGTFLLFSRSLGYGFINYDDPVYLTNNPRVQAGLTWDGLTWAFTGKADYWHPLTWLSHMLDWSLFGANATGHRAVSVLWHAANAGLAFLLVRRLIGSAWLAFFSAALFAWHPLRVESVVWVTERKDVMSGAFFLLTLLAWLRYGELFKSAPSASPGPPSAVIRPASRARAYGLTLALFLGGLMCKPSLVTLPLVLLALDGWPLGRLSLRPAPGWWAAHRRVMMEKLPFLLLSALITVVTIRMQQASHAFQLAIPLGDRLGNAVVSVARYLGNFAWPSGLAMFYEHPGAWPATAWLGALALLAALTGYVWSRRDRAPRLLTGWLWFLAMLLPSLGILQVGLQAMADRYTYLPILGLQLALFGGIAAWPGSPRVKAAGAGLILAACAALTWRQQGFWRDSISLYQRAVALDPASAHAHAFLGYTYQEAGDFPAAERHANRALELSPDNHWAWLTLARLQGQTGKFAEALTSYQRLIDLNPQYARGHYLRGLLFMQLGRLPEAETALARASELDPESPAVYLPLAEARARQRKFTAAADAYAKLLILRPRHAEAIAGLGYLQLLQGNRAEAVKYWEEALRLNPEFPGLQERLRRIRK